MKKILIISDSHGSIVNLKRILKKTNLYVDYIIHLGDGILDVEEFKLKYSNIKFLGVRGNCDDYFNVDFKLEDSLKIFNKKIFFTHGHKYNVKMNFTNIYFKAREEEADIFLFGHTHVPIIFEESDIKFLNPGSISYNKESYGIIDIYEDGTIKLDLIYKNN